MKRTALVRRTRLRRTGRTTCVRCGQALTRQQQWNGNKYCSSECRNAAYRKPCTCVICGAVFDRGPGRKSRKTCSSDCLRTLRRRAGPRPRPRGRSGVCAGCGNAFVSYRTATGWTKYCCWNCYGGGDGPSQAISRRGGKARIAQARQASGIPPDAPVNNLGQACVIKECPICGDTFLAKWSQRLHRKTCSVRCAAELKRRRGGGDRRGQLNPNYKTGRRIGIRDRAGEARWAAARGNRCMAPWCGALGGGRFGLVLHHICYRQHIRKVGGDEYDPRNALTLCSACHIDHHSRRRVLPVSCLPDDAIRFASELLGARTGAYLSRYYAR